MSFENDHLMGLHDTPVSECLICEKDMLIEYQRDIIENMGESYRQLVKNTIFNLRSLEAFHAITNKDEPLIPEGPSKKWIPLTSDHKPYECEEVHILVTTELNGKEQQLTTRGYLMDGKWFSSQSRNQIKNVMGWKKIRGQSGSKGFGSKRKGFSP